jgi:hypothetical protein
MSDNLRQYRAIRDAFTQGYPTFHRIPTHWLRVLLIGITS